MARLQTRRPDAGGASRDELSERGPRPATLESFAERVRSMLQADCGFVGGPNGLETSPPGASGLDAVGDCSRPLALLRRRITASGEGAVIRSASSTADEAEVLHAMGMKSVAVVTVRDTKQQVVGICGVGSRRDRDWSAAELAILSLAAESRQLQGQLGQAAASRGPEQQRLESLTSFAAVLSHDLNNIFTAILGSCDMAVESLPEGSFEQQLLATALRETERAAALSRDIMTFAGRARCVPTEVDVPALVARVLEEGNWLQQGSRLCVCLAEDLPEVTTDGVLLGRALVELLANALEAVGDRADGRVQLSVTAGPAAEEDDCAGSHLEFVVEDNGCGIPDDVRGRVFEPFVSTRGRKRGMGLSLVYGIAARLSAVLRLEPVAGGGTRVVLRLPTSA
jgi:signal transduction histidine kinase